MIEQTGRYGKLEVDQARQSGSAVPNRSNADLSRGAWSCDALHALVGSDLQQVEQLLCRSLASRYPLVQNLAEQATSMGGKRLRPMLTLLSAFACGQVTRNSIRVAGVVELVHAASLVHDDVLDNAAQRRHQQTIHARVGAHSSIVLGDYLFTRAYRLAASCRSNVPARAIATAATALCEGELRQHASIARWDISQSEYLDILRQKTGELCAVSCRLGGWSAGGTTDELSCLSRFGRKLGIAFQIFDDWLDIWGSDEVGKTLGTDWSQRKPTLPLIRALSATSVQQASDRYCRTETAAGVAKLEQLDWGGLRRWLDSTDASAYTLDTARALIDSGLKDLRRLPLTAAREQLASIAAQCVQRRS